MSATMERSALLGVGFSQTGPSRAGMDDSKGCAAV